MKYTLVCTLLAALSFALPRVAPAARPDGELTLRVVDAETQQPLAARVILRRGKGRALRNRDLGVARHGDHFYVDGAAELGLRRGQYTFDLKAGPEYKPISGHFEIERRASDGKQVEMHRATDLQDEGWLAADLLAERGGKNLDAVLRAEGLRYCPLTAWQQEDGKWDDLPTAEPEPSDNVDEEPGAERPNPPTRFGPYAARLHRESGDLLFVRPDGPLTEKDLETIGEASLEEMLAARDVGLRIVAADATSWRLPVWLAADVLDAVVVIDDADQEDRRKPWGRPRDKAMFPRARGAGRWSEAIYFNILEAGLRVAPAAGSNTGRNELPLGAARVYANPAGGFDAENWWDSLSAGESFVTNGPLLRPHPVPGRTLRLHQDDPGMSLAASLTTGQRIEYLEVIQNGEVVHSAAIREVAKNRGRLPRVECSGSGWLLLRACAADESGYVRAMTAPYFYQPLDGEPRVSKKACEFFLAWLSEAEAEIAADELVFARAYWEERGEAANAP